MKKYFIFGLLTAMLITSTGAALAAKPVKIVSEVVNSKGKATVSIPANAVEIALGLFSLGTAIDPGSGEMVQGYAIVRYKKGYGKPGTVCGNDICEIGENAVKCPVDCAGGVEPEPDTSSCYTFLANGAKWKAIEPWMVDSANSGLNNSFVSGNLASDIAKWETAAGVNILGNEVTNTVDGADMDSPDNKNEVMFADIEQSNAIAVTIVWGIFGGRPSNRALVEWDQVYDNVDFDWSSSGETDKMDFENIATHELGHSMGMGDLYESTCDEVTMYGYATEGETKKQTLEEGDIIGISKLY